LELTVGSIPVSPNVRVQVEDAEADLCFEPVYSAVNNSAQLLT